MKEKEGAGGIGIMVIMIIMEGKFTKEPIELKKSP